MSLINQSAVDKVMAALEEALTDDLEKLQDLLDVVTEQGSKTGLGYIVARLKRRVAARLARAFIEASERPGGKIRVCVDPHEWPGREIPEISAQIRALLGRQENGILRGQTVSHDGRTFRIVQDTRYPDSDSRVIGIRCVG